MKSNDCCKDNKQGVRKWIVCLYTSIATILVMCLVVACVDELYIGKTHDEIQEELSQTMFEADSLLENIKLILGDSTGIRQ